MFQNITEDTIEIDSKNTREAKHKINLFSKVFTKESLQRIQDEMRVCCIKSYNKHYEKTSILKQKKKGRNQDIV